MGLHQECPNNAFPAGMNDQSSWSPCLGGQASAPLQRAGRHFPELELPPLGAGWGWRQVGKHHNPSCADNHKWQWDVALVYQATKPVLRRAIEDPKTMTLFLFPFSSGVKESSCITLLRGLFLLLLILQNCVQLSLAEPLLHHCHLCSWAQACPLAPKR